MAATSFLLTALILFPIVFSVNSQPYPSFKQIYQFGDSFADTRNLLRLPGGRMFFPADHLPYGKTYFGKPTGRFSDGRLVVDYIASALNLPFLDAYLNPSASFAHGVNFAVAGATALDQDFFAKRNITISNFKPPISKQVEWFETYVNSTCGSSAACAKVLGKALFIFGVFGGNDYTAAFRGGKSVEEVDEAYVPHIVGAITRGIRDIVRLGAKRIVVPGGFLAGCVPSALAASNASDPATSDRFGCLKSFNSFTSYFNLHLKRALSSLDQELSDDGVVIVYGDYEAAFKKILKKAISYGFDSSSLVKACCGAGGEYNFDGAKPCGTNGTTVCSDPRRRVNWDGIHFTDAGNLRMAQFLIGQALPKLR